MATTIEQYLIKRANLIISIQNDYEMLETWKHKEFMTFDRLPQSDKFIVVLCGFQTVHDMLEDTRKLIERKKKSLSRLEKKIKKLNEWI